MSGVPTHGPWCATTAWPTNCPQCGLRVFFFRCTCGSAVFFEQLGHPWPTHRHEDNPSGANGTAGDAPPAWARDAMRRVDEDGSLVAAVSELGFSVIRPRRALVSNHSPVSQRRSKRRVKVDPIVPVGPGDGEELAITGLLREIDRRLNPMKSFGYNDDGSMAVAMATAMMGTRWTNEFGRITVHAPRPQTEQIESYTAWLPSSFIEDKRIKRGITVSVDLVGLDVSDKVRIWFCDDFVVNR